MRIRDWSSDVCSSDLADEGAARDGDGQQHQLRVELLAFADASGVVGRADRRDRLGADRKARAGGLAFTAALGELAAHDIVESTERSEDRRVGQECGSMSRSR